VEEREEALNVKMEGKKHMQSIFKCDIPWVGNKKNIHVKRVGEQRLTCATPSSQPRITSWCPILNLNGFPRVLEESNTFPSASVPDQKIKK